MIRHVILWKLKEMPEEEKKKVMEGIRENLEGLNGKIPGLISLKIRTGALPSSNADLMLDSVFLDEESLKGYAVHPLHVAAANGFVRPYTAVRSCLDFPAEGKDAAVAESEGKIDRLLGVTARQEWPDSICFTDAKKLSADIYGLYKPYSEPVYRRMPQEAADKVSSGVASLSTRTAGGRLRFVTDSEYVAIRVIRPFRTYIMPHMAFLGASGFDVYVKEERGYIYAGSLIPPVRFTEGFEAILHFRSRKERDLTLNFPLYDNVSELYIGLEEGAVCRKAPGYRNEKPVLFYGASITQGGCASRPGNSYQGFLSRWLDLDYINLGFSGSAKGEQAIADYLATLDVSSFVMDYDANSTFEMLEPTHRAVYETFRRAHPATPVLLVSNCHWRYSPEQEKTDEARREIIRRHFGEWSNAGDRNLYYLDGRTMFAREGEYDCTVDGAHPNDLGFWNMAKAIEPFLRKVYGITG